MTNSNSSQMSVSEKLVQHIKGSPLAALLDGDEDAMNNLAKDAIQKALYEKTVIVSERSTPYGSDTLSSPVIIAAQEHAKTLVKDVADRLFANPENEEIIRKAIVDMLPAIIKDYVSNYFS